MSIKPTESELEILNILWEKGSGTVREVHEELEKTKLAGYTTTLKLMQIMHEKKLLTRDATAKTHVYRAAVDRDEARGQLLDRIINTVFSGSAMQLVMQALGSGRTSTGELDQIREYLRKIEQDKK